MQSVYRHKTWSGRFVLVERTRRGIDACPGLEALCRCKCKKVTFVGGRYIQIPVAPVSYQVILEPGIGQFREFEPRREHVLAQIRWDFFLCTNSLAGSARA